MTKRPYKSFTRNQLIDKQEELYYLFCRAASMNRKAYYEKQMDLVAAEMDRHDG